MSQESSVVVVRIGPVEKLPNSDRLSITYVDGRPCVFTSGDFAEGELATYIPVDSMVPVAHPAFSFLAARAKDKTHYRVRAMKLRGTFSMGLLVPPPCDGAEEGEDASVAYGVEKYVPPTERELERVVSHNKTRNSRQSETVKHDREVVLAALFAMIIEFMACPLWLFGLLALLTMGMARFEVLYNRKRNKRPNIPVYDIEGFRKHSHVFKDGEMVSITEKIHGMNASFVHTGKRFHAKSRTMFRPKEERDRWWKVAEKYDLESKLKQHPNMVLFGEVYGSGVQDLEYGCANGEIKFAAFDVMNLETREYLSVGEFQLFCAGLNIPVAPELYWGPYSRSVVERLSEGKTTVGGDHVREGVVTKPEYERTEHGLGRCVVKLAGQGYLLRAEKDEAA